MMRQTFARISTSAAFEDDIAARKRAATRDVNAIDNKKKCLTTREIIVFNFPCTDSQVKINLAISQVII